MVVGNFQCMTSSNVNCPQSWLLLDLKNLFKKNINVISFIIKGKSWWRNIKGRLQPLQTMAHHINGKAFNFKDQSTAGLIDGWTLQWMFWILSLICVTGILWNTHWNRQVIWPWWQVCHHWLHSRLSSRQSKVLPRQWWQSPHHDNLSVHVRESTVQWQVLHRMKALSCGPTNKEHRL